MPQRPLRPCCHKGCRELHRNPNSYCEQHQEDAKAWARPSKTHEDRLRGRKAQARRLRLFAKDPHCAICGKLTDWPDRFEIDHIVPISQGGKDDDSNLQLLCMHKAPDGTKSGCHAEKTDKDLKRRPKGDGE